MKHARKDYTERIIDTARLIPDMEPVLLIRAQDEFSENVAEYYVTLVREKRIALELDLAATMEDGVSDYGTQITNEVNALRELENAVSLHASSIRAWPVKKLPDITPIPKINLE